MAFSVYSCHTPQPPAALSLKPHSPQSSQAEGKSSRNPANLSPDYIPPPQGADQYQRGYLSHAFSSPQCDKYHPTCQPVPAAHMENSSSLLNDLSGRTHLQNQNYAPENPYIPMGKVQILKQNYLSCQFPRL